MRAAYIEEPGGPQSVRVGELPDPEPSDGDVLIRVRAAAVGSWDTSLLGTAPFPRIPGSEVAGVVERAPQDPA